MARPIAEPTPPAPTAPVARRRRKLGLYTPPAPAAVVDEGAGRRRRVGQASAIQRRAGSVVATPLQAVEHTPIRGHATGWQRECYEVLDAVPVIGYLVNLKANTGSLGVLRVEEWVADETTGAFGWRASTEQVPNDRLAELQCEIGGQKELLRLMLLHLETAGRFYLVQLPEIDAFGQATGVSYWEPYSVVEMDVQPDRFIDGTASSGLGVGKVRLMGSDVVDVLANPISPKASAIVDCIRRSPKMSTEADSPLKRLLTTARTLVYLGLAVDSIVRSRANGGLFYWATELSEEMEDTDDWTDDNEDGTGDLMGSDRAAGDKAKVDPVTEMLWLHMQSAVEDPSSVGSFAPGVVRGPGEFKDKIGMIDTVRRYDDLASLRAELHRELAVGYDAPAEKASGMGGVAGWGAYSIDADWNRRHVIPPCEFLAEWLTKAVFRTLLVVPPDGTTDEPMSWTQAARYRLVYDGAGLDSRIDPTANTGVALDNQLIGDTPARSALGFTDADAASDDEKLQRRAWALAQASPGVMAPALMSFLGFPDEIVSRVDELAALALARRQDRNSGGGDDGGPGAPSKADGAAPAPQGPAVSPPSPTAPSPGGSKSASVLTGVAFHAGTKAAERVGARARSRFDKLGPDRASVLRGTLGEVPNGRVYAHLTADDHRALGMVDPVGELDEAMWAEVRDCCAAFDAAPEFFVDLARGIACTLLLGQEVGLPVALAAADKHLAATAGVA